VGESEKRVNELKKKQRRRRKGERWEKTKKGGGQIPTRHGIRPRRDAERRADIKDEKGTCAKHKGKPEEKRNLEGTLNWSSSKHTKGGAVP